MRYMFLRFPEGRGKALTFSYDDGVRSDIRLADTFTRYGVKATFNLIGDEARGDNGLKKDEVEEHILSRGHEVAVHGSFHRAEGYQRTVEGIKDVLFCRTELEEKFGRIIRGMAYPDSGITRFGNGASYEKIRTYLSELDIAYARTLGGDNAGFQLPADWYAWMPTAHHANPNMDAFIDAFLNIDLSNRVYRANRAPRLFYVWGHSFEFEQAGNWNLLEGILTRLSGRDDIWYATNIEIHDYVEAYNSLVFSANGKIIYNPTLYDIWFDIDGVGFKIAPGEELKL